MKLRHSDGLDDAGKLDLMTPEEKLEAIVAIASKAHIDDTVGDARERADTILWIATDGQQGRDWGHPRDSA